MIAHVDDLIRLFGETDWHEVIGASVYNGFPLYTLSDGRSVSDLGVEAVLDKER